MEDRLKTILYNAISLLIDETFEQYDDKTEWFKMLQNELGCTKEEFEQYGIYIAVNGGLEKNFMKWSKSNNETKATRKYVWLSFIM